MARGKLTVTQDQDSLTATIERAPGEGPTAPAGAATTLQLRGAMTPQGAVFTQKRIASIISNGEAAKREIVVTWVLNATGDTLTGTLATLIEGGPPSSGPAKITGTRVR